jgi:hypothetical protein
MEPTALMFNKRFYCQKHKTELEKYDKEIKEQIKVLQENNKGVIKEKE